MKLTRQHFEMVAQRIAIEKSNAALAEDYLQRKYRLEALADLEVSFAADLAETNPQFDPDRFHNRIDELTTEYTRQNQTPVSQQ